MLSIIKRLEPSRRLQFAASTWQNAQQYAEVEMNILKHICMLHKNVEIGAKNCLQVEEGISA